MRRKRHLCRPRTRSDCSTCAVFDPSVLPLLSTSPLLYTATKDLMEVVHDIEVINVQQFDLEKVRPYPLLFRLFQYRCPHPDHRGSVPASNNKGPIWKTLCDLSGSSFRHLVFSRGLKLYIPQCFSYYYFSSYFGLFCFVLFIFYFRFFLVRSFCVPGEGVMQ